MKVLAIYDDTGRKSEAIRDIIGEKGFGEVVVNKKYLEDDYRDVIEGVYQNVIWETVSLSSAYQDVLNRLERYEMEDVRVLHCFSNYIFLDAPKAVLALEKIRYIDESFGVMNDKRAVAAMFPDINRYRSFLKSIIAGAHAWDLARNFSTTFEIEGVVNIGKTSTFIKCITGNFDSRYFNSLEENAYTLTKRSANKEKIRAEYTFYQLLPEDMKHWFVQPYSFVEKESEASYCMERLHMTDLAIKWVHGSMDRSEFSELMDQYFYFFSCRHERSCSKEAFQKARKALYEDKVVSRIADLKAMPEYEVIGKMLSAAGEDLDEYISKYMDLKTKVEKDGNCRQAIGHGDPCFANALYNKTTKTLKFIDPKGALKEEDLWTDPYYDVAKLSHSVCGRYDFFNNALYEIRIGGDFRYTLDIPFDNADYKEVFREKVIANGFDYRLVRLYEASLFLSMLPLHIDNPHKVMGFIINARDILKEVEQYDS